jgi:hypothetical protein
VEIAARPTGPPPADPPTPVAGLAIVEELVRTSAGR